MVECNNILCSGSIKLIDSDRGLKVKLNHPFSSGGASCLSFSDCGRYLVCASSGVGEILIYDTATLTEESAPLVVVPVSAAPVHLVARSSGVAGKNKKGSSGFILDIICIMKDKKGCVVRVTKDGNSDATPAISQLVIESTGSTSLLSAQFSPSVESDGLVVAATGSLSAPRFLRAAYLDIESSSSGGKVLSKVTLPGSIDTGAVVEHAIGMNGHSASNGSASEVSLVGPYEMGAAKRPLTDDSDKTATKRVRLEDANGHGEDVKSVDAEFMTMEERLRRLSSALEEAESKAQQAATAQAEADSKKNKAVVSKESIARPTSDSLVVLVEQALQSGDDGLLEQCLRCTDMAIVTETARRLPAQRVVALLRRLVAKFEKRPTRGILVTHWIQAVLKFHVSYLLAVPDLAKQLAGLSQMLDQRLSTYTRLASLAGRLDLLMAQQTSSVSDVMVQVEDGDHRKSIKKRKAKVGPATMVLAVPDDIYYEE